MLLPQLLNTIIQSNLSKSMLNIVINLFRNAVF